MKKYNTILKTIEIKDLERKQLFLAPLIIEGIDKKEPLQADELLFAVALEDKNDLYKIAAFDFEISKPIETQDYLHDEHYIRYYKGAWELTQKGIEHLDSTSNFIGALVNESVDIRQVTKYKYGLKSAISYLNTHNQTRTELKQISVFLLFMAQEENNKRDLINSLVEKDETNRLEKYFKVRDLLDLLDTFGYVDIDLETEKTKITERGLRLLEKIEVSTKAYAEENNYPKLKVVQNKRFERRSAFA